MSVLSRFVCLVAVYAFAVQVVYAATLNTFGRNLNRRQVGSVPPQCITTCDPVNQQLQTSSCPPSQCCTPQFEGAYFNCLQCVGQGLNITDFSQGQALLDGLIVTCSRLGRPLPKMTLPGQDAERVLSTSPIATSTLSSSSASTATSTSATTSATSATPASTTVTTPPATSTVASRSTVFPTSQSLTTTSSTPASSPTNNNGSLRLGSSKMMLILTLALGVWIGL